MELTFWQRNKDKIILGFIFGTGSLILFALRSYLTKPDGKPSISANNQTQTANLSDSNKPGNTVIQQQNKNAPNQVTINHNETTAPVTKNYYSGKPPQHLTKIDSERLLKQIQSKTARINLIVCNDSRETANYADEILRFLLNNKAMIYLFNPNI